MKSSSNIKPQKIEAVGNGSYQINYNITEKETIEFEFYKVLYEYETIIVCGYPTYENVVGEIIREKYSYDFREAAIRKGISNPNDPDYVAFNDFAEQTKLMVKELLK